MNKPPARRRNLASKRGPIRATKRIPFSVSCARRAPGNGTLEAKDIRSCRKDHQERNLSVSFSFRVHRARVSSWIFGTRLPRFLPRGFRVPSELAGDCCNFIAVSSWGLVRKTVAVIAQLSSSFRDTLLQVLSRSYRNRWLFDQLEPTDSRVGFLSLIDGRRFVMRGVTELLHAVALIGEKVHSFQ